MKQLKQLPSGLVVPSEPEKPPKRLPGIVQDASTRKEIADGLMMVVRALKLDGRGGGIELPSMPDKASEESLRHLLHGIGGLCLGSFYWEEKT